MKKLLFFLFAPLTSFSQTDTIYTVDRKVIPCRITYKNNNNIFYNSKGASGLFIDLKKVAFYCQNGVKISISDDEQIETARTFGGQQIKVITKGGIIVRDNEESPDSLYFSHNPEDPFIFIVKPGYATKLITADTLTKLKKDSYAADLIKLPGGDLKNAQRKLVFKGFIDKTDKVKIIDRMLSQYQYTLAKLDGQEFKDAVAKTFEENGFKIDTEEDIFVQKRETNDLALAGEILFYKKETRGMRGFKMSAVVRWTLYDVVNQENVIKITTGGYSNTKQALNEKEALLLTLKDALGGVIVNKSFEENMSVNKKQLFLSKTSEILIRHSATLVPNDNYIQNSIQSAVTIQSKSGHGSGFLISTDGYILTNYHVIKDSVDLQAIFQNDITLPLQVISYDSKTDVALCKVPGKGYKPMAVDTGNVLKKVGIDVVTIGTPADIKFGQTVTKGIVSGIREINDNLLIQTDVSVNPGNSGGMLINKNGEVIGVIVSKIIRQGIEGIAFAIPINLALEKLKIKITRDN
jgi:serine protease Do